MHIKGEISFGVIVSFILLTNRFRVYLLRLMGLVDVFQRGAKGIGRFLEVMEITNTKDGNIILSKNIDSIKVEGLNFAFDKQKIIKNLSLTIEKGEKVAFVGESGVGKTTTSVNLSSALAYMGHKVLLVDIDPQANATQGLGVDRTTLETTIYDALTRNIPFSEIIIDTNVPGLSIVPSNIDLSGLEIELSQLKTGSEQRIK